MSVLLKDSNWPVVPLTTFDGYTDVRGTPDAVVTGSGSSTTLNFNGSTWYNNNAGFICPIGIIKRDMTVVARFKWITNAQVFILQRVQDNNGSGNTGYSYGHGFDGTGGTSTMKLIKRGPVGTFGTVNSSGTFSAPTVGDVIRVTAKATGATPTSFVLTVYNETTQTQLGTHSTTDSTANMQVAGQSGVATLSSNVPFLSITVLDETSGLGSISSITPSSGTAGSSISVDLVGSGTSWVNGTTTFGCTGGGSVTSVTVTDSTHCTVVFTPGIVGTCWLYENTGGTNGATATFLGTAAAATTYTLSGPTSLTQNVASTYTVALYPNGATATSTVVTPAVSGVSGTFSPTTVTISTATPSATFTFTPTTGGAGTLSTTNNNSLTDPSSISINVAVPVVIPVNSAAFLFSPGNWVGDTGRGGSVSRSSWNAGAYFRLYWSTTGTPSCVLNIYNLFGSCTLAYKVDGKLTTNVSCPSASNGQITISGLSGTGNHILEVYIANTSQTSSRWAGNNNVTFLSAVLDPLAVAGTAPAFTKWALFYGDSITEGIAAGNPVSPGDNNLTDYSYLVGQSLRTQGWEYCVKACGSQGWDAYGANDHSVPGIKPAVSVASGGTFAPGSRTFTVPSTDTNGLSNGSVVVLDDGANAETVTLTGATSTTITCTTTKTHTTPFNVYPVWSWDKINSTTSLLDSNGRISAYGATGTEPYVVYINEGSNESIRSISQSTTQLSVAAGLKAIRGALPASVPIRMLMPFGLANSTIFATGANYITWLTNGFNNYQTATPDSKTALVNFGADLANALASTVYGAGVHPNQSGHALIAPLVANDVNTAVVSWTGSGVVGMVGIGI